jgi:hypothetical protein
MVYPKIFSPRWFDALLSFLYRIAASGYLPASLFRSAIPKQGQRQQKKGYLDLEIVSHCWNYSSMLAYQLSSFIKYPPTKLSLTVTVVYSKEDNKTTRLLEFIGSHQIENITWNWLALDKKQVFRRGIGRNLVAKNTQADWIWFTDCDIVFHEGCLDSLASSLQNRTDSLVFPKTEYTTPMLPKTDKLFTESSLNYLSEIDINTFQAHTRDRAKGAYQIVHGDVARAIGYCDGVSIYQTPSDHWCKCYEDRAFRWLVGSKGVPIDVKGLYQIRHVHKGRYKENKKWSQVRSKIRRMQETY